jgi:putative PIG3 family NAD(P)H quinone oxidoreductase
MTAIAISEPGGPEVLQPVERPVPQPGPGEVLIRVAAAGVNRPDVLQRMGFYPPPPGASDLPGLEVAGTIVAVGPGGDPGQLGQAVCALVAGGGYAQYCTAPAGSCLPVPKGFSMAEAAALPETVFTVWHNLFERAWVKEGETVLVHGGTSGIGTTAIGLCKLFDIKVIVTCGSAGKCDAARALGADLAVDYSAEDYVEAVKSFTGGRGVDAVLDMVGGDYLPRNLACLADDGRHVSIAFQRGMTAEINISDVMRRRLTLTGSTLRARSAGFKAALADEIHRTLWPQLSEGRWKPAMDQSFPLAEASAAHARMQAGEHVGKIVLEV